METTMMMIIASIVIGILGLCVFAWNVYQWHKWNVEIVKNKNVNKNRSAMDRLKRFKTFKTINVNNVDRIKSSGKTHVANYTKYRYNGSSKRDVEVWHSPTNIWVQYYLMFNTPFEDSCIRYNGEDVTGYDNTSTTQHEASESTFSRSQYDGSSETISCDTVRSRSYYDDSYSSSSPSDSYGDSGSSSSSSSG